MNFQQKLDDLEKKFEEFIKSDLKRQVRRLFKIRFKKAFNLHYFYLFLQEEANKSCRKAFVDLGLNTSCNGFPHLFKTERTILKILWIICIIVSTATCAWMVSESINDYLQFDVITKIETVPVEELTYPAIMICIENVANNSDIYTSYYKLNQNYYYLSLKSYYYFTLKCITINDGSNSTILVYNCFKK